MIYSVSVWEQDFHQNKTQPNDQVSRSGSIPFYDRALLSLLGYNKIERNRIDTMFFFYNLKPFIFE